MVLGLQAPDDRAAAAENIFMVEPGSKGSVRGPVTPQMTRVLSKYVWVEGWIVRQGQDLAGSRVHDDGHAGLGGKFLYRCFESGPG